MIARLLAAGAAIAALGAAAPAAAAPAAEVFAPGVVSTEAEEWRISFTPDGRTAYFGRSAEFFPVSRQATILETRRRGAGWTEPVVAGFSGTYPDIDPFVTADGSTLLFSSIRPVAGEPRTDADLWMVPRTRRGGWGEPVHLGAAVNSAADELYPTVTRDGTLYFASDRTDGLGGFDIYRSRRGPDGRYGRAENLGAPVNTAAWEFNPVLTPGGALLFVGLDRPGGYGYGDLWLAERRGRGFGEPANLGPTVNTAADEYHPSLSPDLSRLYFVRHTYEPWLAGDLYVVPTACLPGLGG
jgi:hypothetical protein